MSFTDEDLERLKMYPGSLIDVPALLARLSAAERFCKHFPNCQALLVSDCNEYNAWLLSKGLPEGE